MTATAAEIIGRLGLVRHPEGGWFRESYRSAETIAAAALPGRFTAARSLSTSIYFLLEQGDISAFHRIKSDELWYFHTGAPLTIHIISADGVYRAELLGGDLDAGAVYQAVVPAGSWFGAELAGDGAFALVGCAVSPGFDFTDFELAGRAALEQQFPGHAALIRRLTKNPHEKQEDVCR